MDTALLGLRVALSLACVLGLIWFAGRRLQGSAVVRKQRTVPLSVLGRQSLGKGAGIALVEVAGRVLLVGVGEQGVSLLTEIDVPDAPAKPTDRGAEVREEIDLTLLPADEDARPGATTPHTPAPDADLAAAFAGVTAPRGRTGGPSTSGGGTLDGSALSPDTWRRAVDVVQRRTARR